MAEARRGAFQELLGVVAVDAASEARLRRVAIRYGLDPDRAYRLVAIAPRPEADPIPERPGIGEEELEVLAGRIGHLLGSAAPGAEGIGPGIRLPAVLPLLGRIAVLARDDWAGLKRVPNVLDTVLGGLAAAALSKGRRGEAAPTETAQAAWVAVGSAAVDGVGLLGGDLCRSHRRHAHRAAARPARLDPGPAGAGARAAAARGPGPRGRHRAGRARPGARRRALRRGAHRDAPGLFRCR